MLEKINESFTQTSLSKSPQMSSSLFGASFASDTSISRDVSKQNLIVYYVYFNAWFSKHYEFSSFPSDGWSVEVSLFSKWLMIPYKSLWCFIIFWWWLLHWSADLVLTYLLSWRKTFSYFLLYWQCKRSLLALIKSRNLRFSKEVHLFELH
jgi:hypothetical protein